MKVYINPNAVDGIKRVIDAQYQYLPEFGAEMVSTPEQADVICNHGTSLDEVVGVPSVHVGHGLYWSRQPWGSGYQEVNQMVVESMRRAAACTVPSEWVGRAVRRGGFFYPEVVYHGVDADQFKPSKTPGNYVLWNKARADYVSDPGDMLNLAQMSPKVNFVSTIGSMNKQFKNPENL